MHPLLLQTQSNFTYAHQRATQNREQNTISERKAIIVEAKSITGRCEVDDRHIEILLERDDVRMSRSILASNIM